MAAHSQLQQQQHSLLTATTLHHSGSRPHTRMQGTTRDVMPSLAHFSEFNELIGLEAKIAAEERLTNAQGGEKLVVKVRAPVKRAS